MVWSTSTTGWIGDLRRRHLSALVKPQHRVLARS